MAMDANVQSDMQVLEGFLKHLMRTLEIEAARDPLKACADALLKSFNSEGGLSCRTVPPHLKEAFEEMLVNNHVPFMGTEDSAGNYVVFLPASASERDNKVYKLIDEFCMHYAEYYMQHTPETFLRMVKADEDKTVKCYTFKSEEERAIFINKCYDDGKGFVVTTLDGDNGYSVIMRTQDKENKALASHILTMEEMSVARKLAVRHDGRQLGSAIEAISKNKPFALYDARNHTTSTYVQYKDGVVTVQRYNSLINDYVSTTESLKGKSTAEITGYFRHLMAEIPNCKLGNESEFAAFLAESEINLAEEFTNNQLRLYKEVILPHKEGREGFISEDDLETKIREMGLSDIRPGYNIDTLEYIKEKLVQENHLLDEKTKTLFGAYNDAMASSERLFMGQLSEFSKIFLNEDITTNVKPFSNVKERYAELENITEHVKGGICVALDKQKEEIFKEQNAPTNYESMRKLLSAVAANDDLWKDAPFDESLRDSLVKFSKYTDEDFAKMTDNDNFRYRQAIGIATLKATQDTHPKNADILRQLSTLWEYESSFKKTFADLNDKCQAIRADRSELAENVMRIKAINRIIRNERNDHARIKPLISEFDRIDAAHPDYSVETRYQMKMDVITGKTPLSDAGQAEYKAAMKDEYVASFLKEKQQEYISQGLPADAAKEEAEKTLVIEFENGYEHELLSEDFMPFKGIDKENIENFSFDTILTETFEEEIRSQKEKGQKDETKEKTVEEAYEYTQKD